MHLKDGNRTLYSQSRTFTLSAVISDFRLSEILKSQNVYEKASKLEILPYYIY